MPDPSSIEREEAAELPGALDAPGCLRYGLPVETLPVASGNALNKETAVRIRNLFLSAPLIILVLLPAFAAAQGAAKERSEIDPKYQWKLTDIYADDALWEADFERIEALIPVVAAFEGRLGESGETLLAFQKKSEELSMLTSSLIIYSGLKGDEDARVSLYKGMRDRARGLAVRSGAALAWVEPELLSIPKEKLQRFLDETDGLKIYQHAMEDMWRTGDHVLSDKEEKILSLAGDLASIPRDVYNQMSNADLRFGSYVDENGEEVEMTRGRYARALQSLDRGVRKEAFRVYYDGYAKQLHGSAAALSGAIKRDLFYTRTRGYESCIESALDGDNVKVEVLDNLIATIRANMDPVKRYYQIRKRELGLDTLYHWDTYVPITGSAETEVPFEEAVETILAGLAPLGDDYLGEMETGFRSGWIDVYENVGKRSGAYSWGSAATPHPFMLLNYQDRLHDMFTLAHEMGHAMHTMRTTATQPYVYSGITLFVAEVASTTNEAILMHHLLNTTEDREMKIRLLNQYIQQILGTVYIQVMFSEFEKGVHEMAERGEPITVESLNDLYLELIRFYAGGEVNYVDASATGWTRIHHFYRNFYVYKYATSYSAATAISGAILAGEPGARERHLRFLESGSSDYPIGLLKKAGVDLSSPEPIQATCDLLAKLVEQLDALLQEG